jgi:tetratricopeptide (TPR) repeat protein
MDRLYDRRRSIWIAALLGLLTLATYWPVVQSGFIDLDDTEYVTENTAVREGLNWGNVKWAFAGAHSGNWHPLTWLSHMLDVQLFGLNPSGHHLINLLLHTASTLILFHLIRQMTRMTWPAAFVAALFALHPLHVESVAWIAERKDVLSAFFFLLTLLAYSHYARARAADPEQRAPHLRWYVIALVMFALGLMSKPMLVTLPFILVLLDFWPLERIRIPLSQSTPRIGSLLLEKVPFLAMSVIVSVLTFSTQSGANAVAPVDMLPIQARMENAVASYLKYLGKTFWPANLSIFYPHPSLSYAASEKWSSAETALGAILLLVISVVVFRSVRRRPWLAVGWFWFLGILIPVIGIVQVGRQAMADRYTYVPLIGIFIGIVWETWEWLRSRTFAVRIAGCAAAAILIVCLAVTRAQLAYWKNDIALFSHALSVNARNPKAQFSLGQALVRAGRDAEAIPHFEAAINDEPTATEFHYSLGVALANAGRLNDAALAFDQVLTIAPGHVNASNALVKVLVLRGGELMNAGRTNDAASLFSFALKMRPRLPEEHFEAAQALAKQGHLDEAVARMRIVVWLKPDDFKAREYLGITLAERGGRSEAIAQFRQALQLNSDEPAVLNDLAWILATAPEAELRDGAEAVTLAEHACRLTEFKQPLSLGTLAAAYAETGRFGEAITTAEKARDLAKQSGLGTVAQGSEQMLEQFRSGKAYREQ